MLDRLDGGWKGDVGVGARVGRTGAAVVVVVGVSVVVAVSVVVGVCVTGGVSVVVGVSVVFDSVAASGQAQCAPAFGPAFGRSIMLPMKIVNTSTATSNTVRPFMIRANDPQQGSMNTRGFLL
jgi:hypothetical protein